MSVTALLSDIDEQLLTVGGCTKISWNMRLDYSIMKT